MELILDESFFEEQAEQSQIKAEIVTQYFLVWSKIIIAAQKKYKVLPTFPWVRFSG
jgi:hypothetical protein